MSPSEQAQAHITVVRPWGLRASQVNCPQETACTSTQIPPTPEPTGCARKFHLGNSSSRTTKGPPTMPLRWASSQGPALPPPQVGAHWGWGFGGFCRLILFCKSHFSSSLPLLFSTTLRWEDAESPGTKGVTVKPNARLPPLWYPAGPGVGTCVPGNGCPEKPWVC